MAKRKRITKAGIVYHAFNRANGKLRIFKKDMDFIAFENILAEGIDRYGMRICGYCIMSNHWHLVLWPPDDDTMPAFMHWITMTHTQRWHAAHGTTGTGHVYQGRYKSFPVQSNQSYFRLLKYVEANPLAAGIVTDPADWPWSSFVRRNDPARPFEISAGPMPLPADWPGIVKRRLSEKETENFANCIKRGFPYGEKDWVKETAKLLNLESTLRKKGRPRKYPEGTK